VFKPCSIDLGIGVYYTFPSYSQAVIKGVHKPAKNSRSPRIVYSGGAAASGQQLHMSTTQKSYLKAPYDRPLEHDSMLSRLYRDYDNPQDYTLHYSDRLTGNTDQRYNLALIRPQLNIQKATLHLPGCRFPVLHALTQDFYHPVWDARPWDDDFSTFCGPSNVCGDQDPDFLNSTMMQAEDDSEYLVYDSRPFQALGNGMVPDISSLGDHALTIESLFEEGDVIHKVYMRNADKGNECLQLDAVCDYDTNVISEGIINGVTNIAKPIFSSYSDCGDSLIDFADGYPCVAGFMSYQGEDLTRNGIYDDVLAGLGLDTGDATSSPSEMLIYLGSGIIAEEGMRLDGGCLLVDCSSPTGGYEDSNAICAASTFLDRLGNYDWDADHFSIYPTMSIVERQGASSIQLDGTIQSLLEVI